MIQVTVLPLPSSVITASGPTDFCDGDSVVFTANSGAGLSYQWKKYGNFIPGATGQSYTANKPGKYKAVVTDQNGCARGSNHFFVNVNCRIAATGSPAFSARLYPNPAGDQFSMSLLSPGQESLAVSLIDMQGKTLRTWELRHEAGKADHDFDIDGLAPGLYMLLVSNGADTQRLTLIKQ